MPALKLRRNQNTPLDCNSLDDNFIAVLDRSLHQGTQLASTISDLYTTVDNYDFIIALQQCCGNLTQQLQDLQDSIFGDGELATLITNLRNELLLEIAELLTDLNALTLRVNTSETNIATINSSLVSITSSITGLANSKANIDNPIFTGVPKAPTPLDNADPTQIATVGYLTSVGGSLPVGAIIPYGGSVVPDNNFMFANGQPINRITYSVLFSRFGTTYGVGDGSTTFNLPNLQQRVPLGATTGYILGATGGSATHTLSINEMPTHTHTAYPHTHSINDTGHKHTLRTGGVSDGLEDNYQEGYMSNGAPSATYGAPLSQKVTTGITINLTQDVLYPNGSSQPHNNMQPYIVLNYIIKVK
jgi:microcystin-dependent protein